jgi:peptidoglycan/LPS O-acetylase OafA/YrhL
MPRKKLYRVDLEPARGLSILMVFGFHLLSIIIGYQNLPWDGWFRRLHFDIGWSMVPFVPLTLGWHGVAIFFAISGYCIQLSWLQSECGWFNYGIRRFARLFPTYFLWLMVFSLACWFLPTAFQMSCDLPQFLSHLLLVHNWSSSTLWGINPSFWSIAVEVQLYALLPILVFLVSRYGWGKALFVTALLEIVFRLPWDWILDADMSAYLGGVNVYGVTFAYWFSWSIGAWVASRQYAGASQPLAKVPLFIAIVFVLVCWFIRPLSGFSFLAASFATCVYISKKLQEAESGNATSPNVTMKMSSLWCRALSIMGVCSYSLYLLHQPLMIVIHDLFLQDLKIHSAFKMMIHFGVVLPVFTGVAYLSYQYIEKPSALWGRKITV